jgi:nucleoid DNA-binding protein
MNYKQLIDEITLETKLPKNQVQTVVKLLFEKMINAVEEGTRISAPGCRLHTVKRDARRVIMPDGRERDVPARVYGRLTRVSSTKR